MITNKKRVFTGAALALGLVALTTTADARPEPIPKPVEEPEPEESPGTGQDAPDDPEEPEVIEPPEGLDCIDGDEEDQSDCDPDHSGDPTGKRPGNYPPDVWYDDMAEQMYYLQEDLDDMADWGAQHDPYVSYYATWMMSVVQQYYALGYGADGEPRRYSYGRMTRGDFNYYYYYWVRPIYFSLLHYSAKYYESHRGSSEVYQYQSALSEVARSYQGVVLCNYGFNGDDTESREDLAARRAERDAGIDN